VLIATAGHDGYARIWRTTGEPVATLGPMEHPTVEWAIFSDDGNQIATAGYDGMIRIWTVGGQLVRTIRAHKGYINSLEWRGERILSASTDGTARVYEADTGLLLTTYQGHSSGIYSARFDGDGNRVVTASFDGTARIWKYQPFPLVARLNGDNARFGVAAVCGRDSILAGTAAGATHLYTAATGARATVLASTGAPVTSVSCGGDGSVAAAGTRDGEIRIWRNGVPIHTHKEHPAPVTMLVMDAAGRELLAGDQQGNVSVWRIDPWKQLAWFAPDAAEERLPVLSGQFSPDGELFLAFRGDPLDVEMPEPSPKVGTVTVWSSATMKPLTVVNGHKLRMTHVELIAPEVLATASQDRTVKLWNVRTGALLRSLDHSQEVITFAIQPRAKIMTVAVADAQLVNWDWESGQRRGNLAMKGIIPISLAYAPDGALLTAGATDARVYAIDVKEFQPVLDFGPHSKHVARIWTMPRGDRCLALDGNGKLFLWSLARERRDPAEVKRVSDCWLPIRLEDGRPVALPRAPLETCDPSSMTLPF
jgi:WD40 repeat protein